MNGEPLTRHQGFPLRLIMPGWYGVSNVKWLSQIHVQDDRYLGNYQARWYRTLKGEPIDGEVKWTETAITRMRLKSVIARVTSVGRGAQGARLRAERRHAASLDRSARGRWAVAAGDARRRQHAVLLEAVHVHLEGRRRRASTRIVSRATDVNGNVQPEAADLDAAKKTFLEDNGQFPRKVRIA